MAEKSYEIPIYIKPVEGGNGGGSGEFIPMPAEHDAGQQNQQQAVKGAKSNANAAKAFARHLVGKTASTALNNYGNVTGDYVTQQNMQTVIGEVAALGTAVALGPVGIATYAVDKIFSAYNYVSELKRSEREAAFKQQRVYAAQSKS